MDDYAIWSAGAHERQIVDYFLPGCGIHQKIDYDGIACFQVGNYGILRQSRRQAKLSPAALDSVLRRVERFNPNLRTVAIRGWFHPNIVTKGAFVRRIIDEALADNATEKIDHGAAQCVRGAAAIRLHSWRKAN